MASATESPTIVVTGATGLIGSKLVAALQSEGQRVIRAVRREVRDTQNELRWDPLTGTIEREKLEGVDAVVHLAGENIAGRRWSETYKQRLLESRVQGTRLICETIAGLERKPRVLACASAIGFYGDRGNEPLNETAAVGQGFLPELCLQWEQSCQAARDAGIRVANMRLGVVLSPEGGALASMLTPFKLGAGGVVGSGEQHFSWISLDDAVRAIQFVLTNDSLSGPVNLVSPQPATNREFTKTLGRVLSRPTVLPMPAFAARLAFGEMADALLLASARVLPSQLTATGFDFKYPQLEGALRHLLAE